MQGTKSGAKIILFSGWLKKYFGLEGEEGNLGVKHKSSQLEKIVFAC